MIPALAAAEDWFERYPIVLPLLFATPLSTTLSRVLGSESVYEAELRRKGLGWEVTLEGCRLRRR
jgi:hypothetical protein